MRLCILLVYNSLHGTQAFFGGMDIVCLKKCNFVCLLIVRHLCYSACKSLSVNVVIAIKLSNYG